MNKAVAFWSGGKDSGMALDRVRRGGDYEIVALITTVNAAFRRVSMHGVREELIDLQADAIGIPVQKMYVDGQGGGDDYVPAMRATLETFKRRDITRVVFGDIFLEDLRQWRENLLSSLGMAGVFPLWKEDTRALARQFIEQGFKAIVCCTNDAQLKQSDVGRALDAAFIQELPAGVDPCGENGEYHTFVHDGPIFRRPVDFEVGETVYRPLLTAAPPGGPATKGFWFVDLLAKHSPTAIQ
jgi:uncharacterized protein (TIGR00290 family)